MVSAADPPLDSLSSSQCVTYLILLQVMETREELEDASLDQAGLVALQHRNDELAADVCHALSNAFAAESLDEARVSSAKLQYLQRIATEIEQRVNPSADGA